MAVTLDLAGLQEAVETDLPNIALTRVLQTAKTLVERYAPDAPEDVQNEAAIRTCGYILEQPKAAQRGQRVGEYSASFLPLASHALHSSGAAPLLAPWRVHRAGVIAP